METFNLKTSDTFIELNNLLKVLSWVNSGGEAKMNIKEGQVSVNGQVELQVRKKIRAGDQIKMDNLTCNVQPAK